MIWRMKEGVWSSHEGLLEEHPRGLDLGQILGAGFVILYLWMMAIWAP